MKQSRSRNLDTSKPLSVYRKDDLADLEINPAMGAHYLLTGMEKEEEEEKHLQEILTAQILGLQNHHHEDLTIPTPEFDAVEDHSELYKTNFRKPGQYVHALPFFHEDYPAYDMDEEDARFLRDVVQGRWKLHLTESAFEDIISQLELNSGKSAVSIDEAKLFLKEDDDIILLVYEYWLTKKLRLKHSLIPTVRSETVGCPLDKKNPYVAFRRRFEKMQTRKNRKLDENNYALMLKLRRDLNRAVTLLGFVKKRERLKKAELELNLDILEKRVDAEDWDCRLYSEAKAIRKYRKLEEEAMMEPLVSEDDMSVADSDYESDDGPFAFRRKEGVRYFAPRDNRLADTTEFPEGSEDGGSDTFVGSEMYKFVWTHVPGVCVSYARRRVGRGGRIILDRLSPIYSTKDLEISESDEDIPGCVKPQYSASAHFVDWDPYKVRSDESGEGIGTEEENISTSAAVSCPITVTSETKGGTQISGGVCGEPRSPWRKRCRSGGVKTINMNRVGAHNAASAVINSHFIDLFSVSK